MSRPTFICLTPVKNEAWILERFLACASTWADHIVVADQASDDATRSIAARFPKAVVIDNSSPRYDEAARQRLLLDAARRIPAERRVLIALDADEMLTANGSASPEWARVADAAPGTVLKFDWVNVAPGVERGWTEASVPFGFVDDGSPHEGRVIHSTRLPTPDGAPVLALAEVKVLHYQYTNWARMQSKQRWYQCWERLEHPAKRAVTIFRQYNFMEAAFARAAPLNPEWTAGYERQGIDMRTVADEPHYRWDRDVLAFLTAHGPERFRRLPVWDVDWTALNDALGVAPGRAFPDPRTGFDKHVHAWLAKTQARADTPSVRLVQKALQPLGW